MLARAALVSLTLLVSVARAAPPAWQRTEVREPCAASDIFRKPFFGDLHIHTSFSADAFIYGTKTVPRDAYVFAKGGTIPLADDNEGQTRSGHIDRPLDFAAVTDHAEFYGEVRVCDTPGSPVYDITQCQILRQAEPTPGDQFPTTVQWLFPAGVPRPTHHAFCSTPGVDCEAARVSVWQDIQAAAEEAYDRTPACTFTSFVGYEYTASPLGRHLHRNVIFRNEHVPPAAASFIETATGGVPQGLWSAIETQCLQAGIGCDAVVIPHNSNLSDGMAWLDPADADEARRRQQREPLIEIHQVKGNSECRFDRLARAGAGTADELCTFEIEPKPHQGPTAKEPPIDQYPQRNLVRNILKDGLALEQKLGVNPFRTGFVGDTDNHDAAAGSVAESADWPGQSGSNDSSPARQIDDDIRANPGGLTVAWAEENSRDAIFSALARRETYATSGTRPVVRFFGGDLTGLRCGSATFVRDAYAGGTTMGGEIGPVRGGQSPRFAVFAMKDPGPNGVDLQRVQIVKGWVDKKGVTHEQVYDVAGKVGTADVDPATCEPRGKGASELCAIWRDPKFKPRERAFYYVRVLENPTCRWSTRVCRANGVDPLSADCATQAAAKGAPWGNCCLNPSNDKYLDPVVQERAWTSPIWYRPEAVGRLRAKLTSGAGAGADRLTLHLAMGAAAGDLDPSRFPLTLRITDDDEILAVTIPAGTLRQRGHRFALPSALGSLQALTLTLRGKSGASLDLQTQPTDLSRADRVEHMVTIALESGNYETSDTRLWTLRKGALVPAGR
jgi:hypothetical protein